MRHEAVAPSSLARAGRALAWAVLLAVLLELGLQVRSHLRFGQSVFNLAAEKPLYRYDEKLRLKLLTPSIDHRGSEAHIASNSMGLRGPDLPLAKAPGEYRVAVVGASSVMGAYSKTNDLTLAALLQARLRAALPDRPVHVINAGIAGASLGAQERMLRYIAPLQPDLVILYPGFNDFAAYCKASQDKPASGSTRWPLHTVAMPTFLLSADLLLKNTVALRRAVPDDSTNTPIAQLDTSVFRRGFDQLLDTAKALGLQTVVATVARSYRRSQPEEEQQRLAATARYYLPCFTVAELHQVHRLHNDILRAAAAARQLPLVELSREVPGGPRYFADANHFTEAGERLAADVLFNGIRDRLPSSPAP
nr:GDSL-type esterase/lipase family protein [Variovorax boronicumulans]